MANRGKAVEPCGPIDATHMTSRKELKKAILSGEWEGHKVMVSKAAYEKILMIKVEALADMGVLVGLWGPLCDTPRVALTVEGLRRTLLVIMDPAMPAARRMAAGFLLDAALPGWKDVVAPHILGGVVKRSDIKVQHWRKAVFKRDLCACQTCGSKEDLEAHHIVPWAISIWGRVEVANGITLCAECHSATHRERLLP